jgi:hypothetical protein
MPLNPDLVVTSVCIFVTETLKLHIHSSGWNNSMSELWFILIVSLNGALEQEKVPSDS